MTPGSAVVGGAANGCPDEFVFVAAFNGPVDCIEQVFIAKRFGEEFDRSGLHGAHGHWDFSVTCHENNGNLSVGTRNCSRRGLNSGEYEVTLNL